MKITVISDTHISTIKNNLAHRILEDIKSSDICLHAGDFTEHKVFEELSLLTKVYGVCGNMDDDQIRKNLPVMRIIEAGGIRIALTHGRGSPIKILNSIKTIFESSYQDIDIFVFGHSHIPLNKTIDGKIYFNPGSPTDKIFAPYNSYGILNIENKTIRRRLIKIE